MKIDVCKKYTPLWDMSVSEVVEPSGRMTAKTTSNEIFAISEMLQSRYNNVWYCRAESGTIRNTIFSSMIATINLLGLEKLFSWKLSPPLITCVSGSKCYFSGINGKTDADLTATKGFTPQYKTLAVCILDEADQVKHYNHISGWESTALRFLKNDGKMIYAYNPPMSRSHWVFKFFGDKIKNGAVKIYATWKDIRNLLNQKAIDVIEKYARTDPDYYRYWYLGEPVNFKGMVYPQFKRETHTLNIFTYLVQHPNDRVMRLCLGLDEGTVNDSTCVTPIAIMQSGLAIVLDCLEIDPQVTGQQSAVQVSRQLIQFLNGLLRRFTFLQRIPREWIFESAEGGQLLRLQFVEDSGEKTVLVRNKSIMGDVKRVRSMLSERILLFHEAPDVNTMTLIEDIENYVFDEKTGDIKDQQRDDTIDSMEYATKLYYDTPIHVPDFAL